MFFHLFKYRLLKCLRSKEELFWCLFFPVILGTFFFFAFGGIMEKSESFEIIPVAIVIDDNSAYSESFRSTARYVDVNKQYDSNNNIVDSTGKEETDNSLLDITYVRKDLAKDLLDDNKVDGIIYISDKISLSVAENGINQTVLKSFTDNFIQIQSTISNVMRDNPKKLESTVSSLLSLPSYNTELSLTKGYLDPMLQYFYALIAMGCLFGCQYGLSCSKSIKANLSSLGARRCVAPVHKLTVILADFSATVIIQWLSQILLLLYLNYILKVSLGSNMLYMMILTLVGSIIGVSFGLFIGSIKRISETARDAIAISVTMLLCFLSGLMISTLKDIIEHHAPIFNRINPATIITDALYSLNVYSDHKRFYFNMALLLIFAVILCATSYFSTKREDYDSL